MIGRSMSCGTAVNWRTVSTGSNPREEAFMQLVTASANSEIDEILDLIGDVLQLTRAQFEDAERKYHAVGRWLNAENSPLRLLHPRIYAQ
jgi:hypothetical protein